MKYLNTLVTIASCAAVESYVYNGSEYTTDGIDDNMTLFPQSIVEWAAEYKDEIESLQWELQDAIENNVNLIEE